VTGDVKGSIHLFRAKSFIKTVKAHQDCINCIEQSYDARLFVLGKNPYIKIFDSVNLELLDQIKIPCLSMCSKILRADLNIVLGFSGLNCVVYDYKRECEVIKCETKGGARPIAFS